MRLIVLFTLFISTPIAALCVTDASGISGKYICSTQWTISGNNVIEIVASDNGEYSVNAGSFKLTPAVQLIDISRNGITEITSAWFESNLDLWFLDLQYNKLQNISHGLFDNNINLRVLLLGFNMIQTFNHIFQNILTLSVESNLQLGFFELTAPSLLHLTISDTNLSTLPNISSCSMLQTLHATNLRIKDLDISAFRTNRDISAILLNGCTDLVNFPPVSSQQMYIIDLSVTNVTCLDTPSEILAGRQFLISSIILNAGTFERSPWPWCVKPIANQTTPQSLDTTEAIFITQIVNQIDDDTIYDNDILPLYITNENILLNNTDNNDTAIHLITEPIFGATPDPATEITSLILEPISSQDTTPDPATEITSLILEPISSQDTDLAKETTSLLELYSASTSNIEQMSSVENQDLLVVANISSIIQQPLLILRGSLDNMVTLIEETTVTSGDSILDGSLTTVEPVLTVNLVENLVTLIDDHIVSLEKLIASVNQLVENDTTLGILSNPGSIVDNRNLTLDDATIAAGELNTELATTTVPVNSGLSETQVDVAVVVGVAVAVPVSIFTAIAFIV